LKGDLDAFGQSAEFFRGKKVLTVIGFDEHVRMYRDPSQNMDARVPRKISKQFMLRPLISEIPNCLLYKNNGRVIR